MVSPPIIKKSTFWIVDFLISGADSPSFGLFPLFGTFFNLMAPLQNLLLLLPTDNSDYLELQVIYFPDSWSFNPPAGQTALTRWSSPCPPAPWVATGCTSCGAAIMTRSSSRGSCLLVCFFSPILGISKIHWTGWVCERDSLA